MASNISNLLEPMRLAYQASMLPTWWALARQRCLAFLPTSWRELLGASGRRLGIRVQGSQLQFYAADGVGLTPLGALPLGDDELLSICLNRLQRQVNAPRYLLLDDSRVLRRILSLPMAAEAKLRDVIRFEIDRQTPFNAEQVYYEARVLSRNTLSKLCQVELIVLPRNILESSIEPLGVLAADLSGIDVVDKNQKTLNVNLLPDSLRGVGSDNNSWVNLGLAIAGAILLLLAMNQLLKNRELAQSEWEQKVAVAKAQAKEANVLREQLTRAGKAEEFLRKFRGSQPTMLELIGDLTKRIPDDTALDKLSVNEGRLVLVGQSNQAAALVGQLQSSPFIHLPALAGAVQPDARTNRDRFTLTATVKGSKEARNDKLR